MAERLRAIFAGATGWAGSALARGIVATSDMRLVGGALLAIRRVQTLLGVRRGLHTVMQ